jgi:hypothetical protein
METLMSILRTVLVCAVFAASAVAASAASVEVSGMAPTLNGSIVKKAAIVRFENDEPSRAPAVLYDRINRAAIAVCSSNHGGQGAMLRDQVEKCRSVAVRQALREIGSPELVAVASAR